MFRAITENHFLKIFTPSTLMGPMHDNLINLSSAAKFRLFFFQKKEQINIQENVF